MWRRVKRLFEIPDIMGTASKAPLPILAFSGAVAAGSQNASALQAAIGRSQGLNWAVLTDRSVGGNSEASFEIQPLSSTKSVSSGWTRDRRGQRGTGDEPDRSQQEQTGQQEELIGVFSGNLSTLRPSKDPTVKRTGYCAVKINMKRPLKIEGYEGLELRVKTDGRAYVTNLQVSSFFPDELYQGYIRLPKDQWFKIQLPFRDMTLTRLGHLAYVQKDLDSSFQLESIGFLVADGNGGPFRLEVGHMSAISQVTGKALENEDKKAKEGEASRISVDDPGDNWKPISSSRNQ